MFETDRRGIGFRFVAKVAETFESGEELPVIRGSRNSVRVSRPLPDVRTA
jgi:hypothetical protein